MFMGSLVGGVSIVISRLQNVQKELDLASQQAVHDLDRFFENIENDLKATSDMLSATSSTSDVLRRALMRQPYISELLLVDPQGMVLERRVPIIGADVAPTQVEQPWLETVQEYEVYSEETMAEWAESRIELEVLRERKTYFSPVYLSANGVPFIDIARAVTDVWDNFAFTLVARVNLRDLWKDVNELEVGQTGYVYIADQDGRVLAYQDPQLAQDNAMLEELVGRTPQAIAASSNNRYTGLTGDQVLASGEALDVMPWFSIAEQPLNEVLRSLAGLATLLLGVLLLLGSLVFDINRFIQRWITSRLSRLRQGVQELSDRNLEHRIEMQTPDELGALAEAFNSLAAQLQEMIDTLAERVAERTRDLEQRSIQIEAASEIAREAAAIRNVGELLNQTVHLISDRFGFYHAGIFSLDPTGEYAVLQAASSEGGKRMLARGHRLRVGSVGIVGYAAGVGEPRIALNVGADTIYFDNPDLPLTRSEMALPLKVRERVIGVLDVQSVEENAFTEDDVAILQTLADQVALAIDNTRLLGESQRALQELEAFHGEKVRQDWQEQIARQAPAFRYSQAGVTTATADVLQQAASLPLHGRPVVLQDQDDRRLIAPIRLREEAFGSIVLSQEPGQAPWSAEELALIEEVSNQVALALENARLLQDTRRRASQEHLISEVTANVRESLDLDAILQTAVREIGEKLNIAEVEIRMGSGTNHEEKGGPA
jgi:GAF domain-containing protein/HAMP domain-containing protein